ncbi:MAG: carboxylating nicotinate-nucleotide diphosphorylase [Microscillaceae bacterium]
MKYNYLEPEAIQRFIRLALQEDVGTGDHSSLAAVPAHAQRTAQLLVKSTGVIAGITLAQHIFSIVDEDLRWEILKEDGAEVQSGDIGLYVKGKAQSILKAERLVLNCLQRMSGIATLTRRLTQKIAHTSAKLLDTRKTTPNFRMPEKWAVRIGGGHNHRFGLFDMMMLKDNHIAYAGGIEAAIRGARTYLQEKSLDLRIEIETQNLEELRQVLAIGEVDVIMLDNMSPAQMREAVQLVAGRYPLEASGGITEETIVEIAETGVDYISVGALTHSAPSLDISLKAI